MRFGASAFGHRLGPAIMKNKWASKSKGMLFAWGMLAGLIFLFLVPRDAAGRLQLTYARVFRWPLAMGSGVVRVAAPTHVVRNVSAKEYEELLNACRQLRNASANLETQLQEANSLIERLTKLRAKTGMEHIQPIPGKIVMQSKDELTINQGQESGVAVGQYVMSLTSARLNDQCVIGVISSVLAKNARVKLITDPRSKMPVSIGDLHVAWFLEGRGDGTARIANIDPKYAIREHDIVYAEKKRGFLDVPVVAGEVVQCRPDPDKPVVQEVTVRPLCDIADLSDVVVIRLTPVP